MDFQHVEYELSFGTVAQIVPSTLPEIAFAGRSNVGKSSLLNKLFNRKQLARVSQNPGKTATINFYKSKDARFVDLPGYGYAKVSKSERNRWSRLIEGYFAQDVRPLLRRTVPKIMEFMDFIMPKNEADTGRARAA